MLKAKQLHALLVVSAGAWAYLVLSSYYSLHWPSLPITGPLWSWPDFLRGLVRQAGPLVVALWVSGVAAGLGISLLSDGLTSKLSAIEKFLFGFALGMGVLSLLGFFLGILGYGTAAILRIVFVALTTGWVARQGVRMLRVQKRGRIVWVESFSVAEKILSVILFLCLGILIPHVLAPEISYDALVYHLALPHLWQLSGKISSTPWMCFSGMPFYGELLYEWTLALSGEMACKWLDFLVATALLAAVYELSKRLSTRRAGFLACMILLASPMLALEFVRSAIDAGAALYGCLAGYAFLLAEEDYHARRWYVLTGVFAGLAMGSKYTSWALLPALLTAVGTETGWPVLHRVRLGGLILMVAGIVLSPMLAKNFIFFHNPVYPFLNHVIPSAATSLQWDRLRAEASRPLGSFRDVGLYLLDPWRSAMGVSTNGNYLGPGYLLLLPALFWLPKKNAVRRLCWIFAVQWLILTAPSAMPRFWIPALVYLAVLLACAVVSLPAAGVRAGIFTTLAAMLVLNSYWSHRYLLAVDGWAVIGGRQSKADYLNAPHPTYDNPYYAGAQFINTHAGPASRILILGDARSYYVDRPSLAASRFDEQPLFFWARESVDGDALYRKVQSEHIDGLFMNVRSAVAMREMWRGQWNGHVQKVMTEFWGRHLQVVFSDRSLDPAAPRANVVYQVVASRRPNMPAPENVLREIMSQPR